MMKKEKEEEIQDVEISDKNLTEHDDESLNVQLEKNSNQNSVELDDVDMSGNSFFSRIKTKYRARKAKKLAKIQNETLSAEETKKVKEKIEEANKEVSESGKHKKLKNIIFFVFNIVLVAGILIWNIMSSDDFTPLREQDLNGTYIAIVLFLLVGLISMDVIAVHRMIYRKTLRSRWALAYKATGLLRYYDDITPFAAGGQAFMATYLIGRDVPASTALSIPIAKLLFQQFSWLIVTFVCLIVSFVRGMTTLVSAASIIGFILAAGVVAIILFMSYSKVWGKKVIAWILKLLVKIKIIKNYDKHYAKVMNLVEDYQRIMREYKKAKLEVVFQVLIHGARIVLLYSIPYFIYLIFPYQGGEIGTYADFFVYTALIDLASSFFPMPAGTGMNEITFTALFNQYLRGSTFWALLLWRFCSYYVNLLQGLVLISYDTVYGNRKYRWLQTKYALQAESKEFRRMQIENFRQERDKRRRKQKKSSNKE